MKILVDAMPRFPNECPYAVQYKENDEVVTYCGWKGCDHKRHKCSLDDWSCKCTYFKALRS